MGVRERERERHGGVTKVMLGACHAVPLRVLVSSVPDTKGFATAKFLVMHTYE